MSLRLRDQKILELANKGRHAGQIADALRMKRPEVYRAVSRIRKAGIDLVLTPMPYVRPGRQPYMPTPAEIARAAAKERSRWSEGEHRVRAGLSRENHWRPFEAVVIPAEIEQADHDEELLEAMGIESL